MHLFAKCLELKKCVKDKVQYYYNILPYITWKHILNAPKRAESFLLQSTN